MKEINKRMWKHFQPFFFCMCLYFPSIETNLSYLISFMEAQSKNSSQESSPPLISSSPYIRRHGYFSYICQILLFFPQLGPQTVPRQHHTTHESVFLWHYCIFPLSEINSSIASEFFFESISFCWENLFLSNIE